MKKVYNIILTLYKLTGFLILLVLFVTIASAITFTYKKDVWQRRKILAQICQFFSRQTLKLFGFYVQYQSNSDKSTILLKNNSLLVSNHMSYWDILFIASHTPCLFVTSVEIKETPFLGFLTELAGCVYVERRNKSQLGSEIREISEALSYGLNVCIFPEATSTNGNGVLKFRKPLFNSAIITDTSVLPLCINYNSINNTQINCQNRDLLAWYGDMDFFPHLLSIMPFKSIHVDIYFCDAVLPSTLTDTTQLAEAAYQLVEKQFRPFITRSDTSRIKPDESFTSQQTIMQS